MFVSVLTQHGIQQVSFSIYGSVEISPTTTDLDVGLVQIPGMTNNSTSFSAQVLADQWSKPELPNPNRFIADFKTSLYEKFSNITKTELISQPPEHSE